MSVISPPQYIDIGEILINLNDIEDDFDFVAFSGNKAKLDDGDSSMGSGQVAWDGISDFYYEGQNGNNLRWHGAKTFRVTTGGSNDTADGRCDSHGTIIQNCGPVVIRIQPKYGQDSGSINNLYAYFSFIYPSGTLVHDDAVGPVNHSYSGCNSDPTCSNFSVTPSPNPAIIGKSNTLNYSLNFTDGTRVDIYDKHGIFNKNALCDGQSVTCSGSQRIDSIPSSWNGTATITAKVTGLAGTSPVYCRTKITVVDRLKK